jgi:hypothetical protein
LGLRYDVPSITKISGIYAGYLNRIVAKMVVGGLGGVCFQDQHVIYNLNLARVGGFHMQGTLGRSYSQLCFALNDTADGSLRLALRVKINEIKQLSSFIPDGYFAVLVKFAQ